MNNVLILLDSLNDWKPYYKTSSILTVSDYLKNKSLQKEKGSKFVINLSNDYSYNSEGYYCSLLAQPRGHKVIPGVDIINKLEAGAGADRHFIRVYCAFGGLRHSAEYRFALTSRANRYSCCACSE